MYVFDGFFSKPKKKDLMGSKKPLLCLHMFGCIAEMGIPNTQAIFLFKLFYLSLLFYVG